MDQAARRALLADAAARVFARRGVGAATVSDIVAEAGVAQGTFYLSFATKDDVVLAVAARLADRVLDAAEAAIGGLDPVAQLRGLAAHLAAGLDDPGGAPAAAVVNLPENAALHERLAAHLLPRLAPLAEGIVAAGVASGDFEVDDPRAAAFFVLGGLRGIELAGTPPEAMPRALEAATDLALRALGHRDGHTTPPRTPDPR